MYLQHRLIALRQLALLHSLLDSFARKMRLIESFGININVSRHAGLWNVAYLSRSSWCGDDWPSVRTSVDI